jgi:hypothetical protein
MPYAPARSDRKLVVVSFQAIGTIFIETRTQDTILGVLAFVSAIFSSKQTSLALAPPSCLVSELQEPPSPELELRTLPEF